MTTKQTSQAAAQSAPPATLAAALVEAQLLAQPVAKDSVNTFHRYKYASAEGVITEARLALGKAKLALITIGWSFTPADGPRTERGSIGRVDAQYRLIHASGESIDLHSSAPVVPDKGRPEDKAEAGALTTSLAYLLRGLLLLPREDEDSMDRRDDRDYVPPQRQHAGPGLASTARTTNQEAATGAAAGVNWHEKSAEFTTRLQNAATQQEVAALVAEAQGMAEMPPATLDAIRATARQVYPTKPSKAA